MIDNIVKKVLLTENVKIILFTIGVSILVWLFKTYQKNILKNKEERDTANNSLVELLIEATKELKKPIVDFLFFYNLLQYTETEEEYYRIKTDVENEDVDSLDCTIDTMLSKIQAKRRNLLYAPENTLDLIPSWLNKIGFNESIIQPLMCLIMTVYMFVILLLVLIESLNKITLYLSFLMYIVWLMFIYISLCKVVETQTKFEPTIAKFLYVNSFIMPLSLLIQKFGLVISFVLLILYIIILGISTNDNNLINVTNKISKKNKIMYKTEMIIINRFCITHKKALLTDKNLLTFLYFKNTKIIAIFQFERKNDRILIFRNHIINKSFKKIILNNSDSIRDTIEKRTKTKVTLSDTQQHLQHQLSR